MEFIQIIQSALGTVMEFIQIPQSVLETVFSFFKEPDVARLLAGCILWLGFIAFLGFAVTAGHLRFKVRKFRRIVEQGSDRLPAAKEDAEKIFADHFNEIDEKLRKDKAFGHLWSEYGETFVHSPPPPMTTTLSCKIQCVRTPISILHRLPMEI